MTKTLPLRQLLSQPARVKKLTAAGHEVCITDGGKPLWIIRRGDDSGATTAPPVEDDAFWADWEKQMKKKSAVKLPSAARLLLEARG